MTSRRRFAPRISISLSPRSKPPEPPVGSPKPKPPAATAATTRQHQHQPSLLEGIGVVTTIPSRLVAVRF